MARIKYAHIMQHLKRLLKKQGATYATLAKALNEPESTVKKWFTATDGSFERISRIAEALGVSVSAVMKGLEEETLKTFTFTPSQQQQFLKDPLTFQVLWLLVYERNALEEIQRKLSLTDRDLQKALLRLDKMNLIVMGVDDSVKLPRMRPIRWRFEGPFMEKLQQQWINESLEDAQRLELQFYQLSAEAHEEFLKDVLALEEKYARRTIMELNGLKKNLKQVRYLSLMASGSFVKRLK